MRFTTQQFNNTSPSFKINNVTISIFAHLALSREESVLISYRVSLEIWMNTLLSFCNEWIPNSSNLAQKTRNVENFKHTWSRTSSLAPLFSLYPVTVLRRKLDSLVLRARSSVGPQTWIIKRDTRVNNDIVYSGDKWFEW